MNRPLLLASFSTSSMMMMTRKRIVAKSDISNTRHVQQGARVSETPEASRSESYLSSPPQRRMNILFHLDRSSNTQQIDLAATPIERSTPRFAFFDNTPEKLVRPCPISPACKNHQNVSNIPTRCHPTHSQLGSLRCVERTSTPRINKGRMLLRTIMKETRYEVSQGGSAVRLDCSNVHIAFI